MQVLPRQLGCGVGLPRRIQPAFQLFAEQFEIHRFGDAGVTTCLQKTLVFCHQGVRRHRDNRDTTQFWLLPHPRGQGQTILVTKLDIEQHCVGLFVLERTKRGPEILDADHFMAFRFQPVTEQFAIQRVVFHDEDAMLHACSGMPGGITRSSCLTSASCHGCCLSSNDSVCARRYVCSSRLKSLLVRTNTGRSAVRGLARHSPSNSKPLTSGSSKSRITSSGKEAATWARA